MTMIFRLRRSLTGLIAFSIISVFGLSEGVAETYRVYGVRSWDKLNIRTAPSTGGQILASIPPYGTGIELLGRCRGTWCPVRYRRVAGWVSGRYLVREAPASAPLRVKGIANWDVLYLRSKPSTRGRKIGSIPPNGRGVRKLGPCKRNWCRIAYRGVTGWASMMYLVPDVRGAGAASTPFRASGPRPASQPSRRGTIRHAPPPPPDPLLGLEDPE